MRVLADETVPCQYCGIPTRMLGTRLCDGCWELRNGFRWASWEILLIMAWRKLRGTL